VYRIGRWCGGPEAGLLAFLIAIPVRNGIANESLYRVQFSHSHLASALVIWAMVLFLEGRRILPLLMLSIGAYLHVLYSIYVLVPCVLVLLYEAREVGRRRTLQRLAAAVLPLLPFLAWTFAHGTPMTPEWLALLRLRSSHHSFPSFFGDTLPAGAFLMALGTLTLSRLPREKRAVLAWFFVGFALLFVLRHRLHRVHPDEGRPPVPAPPLLAVPDADPLRPGRHGRGGGLARRRPRPHRRRRDGDRPRQPAARAAPARGRVRAGRGRTSRGRDLGAPRGRGNAGGAGRLGLAPPRPRLGPVPAGRADQAHRARAAALATLVLIGRELSASQRRWVALAAAAGTLFWLGPDAYARKRAKWETGSWREVQDWVRLHTPKDAIFVTPPQEAGFRVFSERTVVGEWKDGTQQYFDETFATEWAARMEALGRGTTSS
jgi:hypothetical protein